MFFLRDVCLTSWAIAGPATSSTRWPPNVVVRYRICSSYCRILPNPAREHWLTPPSYMRSQVKCFVEAIASDHAIWRRLRRPQALATACHHKSIFLTQIGAPFTNPGATTMLDGMETEDTGGSRRLGPSMLALFGNFGLCECWGSRPPCWVSVVLLPVRNVGEWKQLAFCGERCWGTDGPLVRRPRNHPSIGTWTETRAVNGCFETMTLKELVAWGSTTRCQKVIWPVLSISFPPVPPSSDCKRRLLSTKGTRLILRSQDQPGRANVVPEAQALIIYQHRSRSPPSPGNLSSLPYGTSLIPSELIPKHAVGERSNLTENTVHGTVRWNTKTRVRSSF